MKNPFKTLFLLIFFILAHIGIIRAQCINANAVYVSPTGTGPGTAASPASLTTAITIYQNNPTRTPLLLQQGNYYVFNTLKLPSGISIEGGFINNNGSWSKNPGAVTNVNVINPHLQYATIIDLGDTFYVAHIIGIDLDSVQNIALKDFNLSVAGAVGASLDSRNGYSVYGIHASHTQNVELLNMTISTDNAQNGGRGVDGRPGNDANFKLGGTAFDSNPYNAGANGGNGGPLQGYVACQHLNCLQTGCELQEPAPTGGTGGSTAGAAGGIGGNAGQSCMWSCYLTEYENRSNDSQAIADILSGTFPDIQPASQAGTPGQPGANGNAGASSNSPGIAREGDEFYIPGMGGKGGAGYGGAGGGGGGAGGVTIIDPKASFITNEDALGVSAIVKTTLLGIVDIANASGNSICGMFIVNLSTPGGDGGGGGGGGEGGGGGGGGGSVYGIYAYLSTGIVTGNVTYNLGDPGEGGEGGTGGPGGQGYPGYPGAMPSSSAIFPSQQGASGGNGGNGGAGGDGQRGASGKKYETWGIHDQLSYYADTSRACTNSVIGIAKNAQSTMNITMNGLASNVNIITNTPTYEEVSVSQPGTIHIIQTNTSHPSIYAFHDIVVTNQRVLPGFTVPPVVCTGDTVSLVPADTTFDGYYWRVYYNGTLLQSSREKQFKFYPPVQTGNPFYHVYLQSYESCCGWSTPAEHIFYVQAPVTMVVAPSSGGFNYSYCYGTDSTQLQVTGAPVVTVWDSVRQQYINTYPGVTWSTGQTSVNKIWIKNNGTYSVTYTSPAGCVSHSVQNYTATNVYPLPTSVPTAFPYNGACYAEPVTLYASGGDSWAYNFYSSPTAPTPEPLGSHVNGYTFTPDFGFGSSLQDSVIIYVASISQYGCVGTNRGEAVVYHEKNAPLPLQPFISYYDETADAGTCGKYVNYQVPTGADWNCSDYVNVTRISGPAPGSLFPIGLSTVVYRLKDAFGNYSDVTTYISVRDTTPPVIHNNISDLNFNALPGACSYNYHIPVPYATDNCQSVNIAPQTSWSGLFSN
ncbi:MAG TPA: HYR domain-containing protein, partial [Chitinophagales bacterium]|nr:HYR domain-containing protein [Chitinophagales bacterium]